MWRGMRWQMTWPARAHNSVRHRNNLLPLSPGDPMGRPGPRAHGGNRGATGDLRRELAMTLGLEMNGLVLTSRQTQPVLHRSAITTCLALRCNVRYNCYEQNAQSETRLCPSCRVTNTQSSIQDHQNQAVPKNPTNSGSTPAPCLDKAVLAQREGSARGCSEISQWGEGARNPL